SRSWPTSTLLLAPCWIRRSAYREILGTGAFDGRGDIRRVARLATRRRRFPGQKSANRGLYGAVYWALKLSAVTPAAPWAGAVSSTLATAGPRRSGAGTGAASGVPLIIPDSPLRPACAILRNTRSSAAAQASRPALPAASSPESRNARCWLLS